MTCDVTFIVINEITSIKYHNWWPTAEPLCILNQLIYRSCKRNYTFKPHKPRYKISLKIPYLRLISTQSLKAFDQLNRLYANDAAREFFLASLLKFHRINEARCSFVIVMVMGTSLIYFKNAFKSTIVKTTDGRIERPATALWKIKMRIRYSYKNINGSNDTSKYLRYS